MIDIFPDDATLHSSSPNIGIIHDKFTSNLMKIGQCCRMKIDKKKTNCMLSGTNQKLAKLPSRELPVYLSIYNHKLDTVESEKLLGVHIDCNLSFAKYVDRMKKYIFQNSTLVQNKTISPSASKKTLLQFIYFTVN